jgi:hypothetical protein
MARASRRWRLNVYLEPTPFRPPVEHVAEALYALGVEASEEQIRETAGSPLAGPLVALVKHMARSSGSYLDVELDGPSLLDDMAVGPGTGG